jgi:hypothetical protein
MCIYLERKVNHFSISNLGPCLEYALRVVT